MGDGRYRNLQKCQKNGRHSKLSTWVRSMYCVWRPYCVQLQAQQVVSMGQKHVMSRETLLCAAIGTESHQRGLEACTVYGDRTVCSCRHSKLSACVRSMYCVWRPYCVWRLYCVQLQAQQDISMGQKHVLCMETVLCAAVSTASCQHGLEAFKVYDRYGNTFKYDIAVLNQSALNQLTNVFKCFHFTYLCINIRSSKLCAYHTLLVHNHDSAQVLQKL